MFFDKFYVGLTGISHVTGLLNCHDHFSCAVVCSFFFFHVFRFFPLNQNNTFFSSEVFNFVFNSAISIINNVQGISITDVGSVSQYPWRISQVIVRVRLTPQTFLRSLVQLMPREAFN